MLARGGRTGRFGDPSDRVESSRTVRNRAFPRHVPGYIPRHIPHEHVEQQRTVPVPGQTAPNAVGPDHVDPVDRSGRARRGLKKEHVRTRPEPTRTEHHVRVQ